MIRAKGTTELRGLSSRRDAPLRWLDDALARAAIEGSFAVVHGPAGAGKTRLLASWSGGAVARCAELAFVDCSMLRDENAVADAIARQIQRATGHVLPATEAVLTSARLRLFELLRAPRERTLAVVLERAAMLPAPVLRRVMRWARQPPPGVLVLVVWAEDRLEDCIATEQRLVVEAQAPPPSSVVTRAPSSADALALLHTLHAAEGDVDASIAREAAGLGAARFAEVRDELAASGWLRVEAWAEGTRLHLTADRASHALQGLAPAVTNAYALAIAKARRPKITGDRQLTSAQGQMIMRKELWEASLLLASIAGATGCASANAPEATGTSADDLRSCATGRTVEGIDVSEFQGDVDWNAVRASGRVFAFVRVSDGTQHPDSTFTANWQGARAAGVIRGAYQFFRPDEDPVAQADLLLETMGPLAADDLPPTLDVEATDGVAPALLRVRVEAWSSHVRDATGRQPIIYVSPGFWPQVGGGTEADTLWVANWGASCPLLPAAWTRWSFWQYDDHSHVPGIAGEVDVDRFNGSLEDLRALLAPPVPAAPANAPTECGVLHPNEQLTRGDTLRSCDGRFCARDADGRKTSCSTRRVARRGRRAPTAAAAHGQSCSWTGTSSSTRRAACRCGARAPRAGRAIGFRSRTTATWSSTARGGFPHGRRARAANRTRQRSARGVRSRMTHRLVALALSTTCGAAAARSTGAACRPRASALCWPAEAVRRVP